MANLTNAQREKQWRTESDANCIRHYTEIFDDKNRLKLAQEYLQKQQEQTQAALTSMQITKNIQSVTGRNGGMKNG